MFTEAWSPSIDRDERYKIFRDYLGVHIGNEDEVPIVGVGIGGSAWSPALEILAPNPEKIDVNMLLRKMKCLVPYQATECTLPKACARPAKGGDEIGHPIGHVGTLGCLVEDDSGQRFILSCNHVIAGLNDGKRSFDETWEPGHKGKRIGILHDFKEIEFGGSVKNVIDAALSKPDPAKDVEQGIHSLGAVDGPLERVGLGTKVHKYGKETGVTHGRVFLTDLSVLIEFGNQQKARFEMQLGITSAHENDKFAATGDSGAVIVDNNNKVVGLLCGVAEANDVAFTNPISEVLGHFKVKLCRG